MEDENSDISILNKGMISITPVHYDLTRHDVLDDLGAYIKGFYPGEI